MQCAFSLNDFELDVFRHTSRFGPLRADELADRMGEERSKVYRALQKLLNCGFCVRETRRLAKGGYYHVYSAIDRKELKNRLERCVEEWGARMRTALDRFDDAHNVDEVL